MHGCWAAWVRLRVEALRSAWAGPFSFAVPAGGCLAITGASGSGKSLLLRMIADLDLHEGEAWLDGVLVGAASARAGIEAQLMLGRSYRVAMRPLVADSIRRGLMPAVNQMAAAGLATLPGIMTGQILAGGRSGRGRKIPNPPDAAAVRRGRAGGRDRGDAGGTAADRPARAAAVGPDGYALRSAAAIAVHSASSGAVQTGCFATPYQYRAFSRSGSARWR